jgi:hypothetical protein
MVEGEGGWVKEGRGWRIKERCIWKREDEKEGEWKRGETKWRRRVEEEGGWSKKDRGGERMERVEEEVGRRMKDEALCALVWSSVLAPLSTRSLATSRKPAWAAQCSAVQPSYNQ